MTVTNDFWQSDCNEEEKNYKEIHENLKIKRSRVVFGDFYSKRKAEAMICILFLKTKYKSVKRRNRNVYYILVNFLPK